MARSWGASLSAPLPPRRRPGKRPQPRRLSWAKPRGRASTHTLAIAATIRRACSFHPSPFPYRCTVLHSGRSQDQRELGIKGEWGHLEPRLFSVYVSLFRERGTHWDALSFSSRALGHVALTLAAMPTSGCSSHRNAMATPAHCNPRTHAGAHARMHAACTVREDPRVRSPYQNIPCFTFPTHHPPRDTRASTPAPTTSDCQCTHARITHAVIKCTHLRHHPAFRLPRRHMYKNDCDRHGGTHSSTQIMRNGMHQPTLVLAASQTSHLLRHTLSSFLRWHVQHPTCDRHAGTHFVNTTHTHTHAPAKPPTHVKIATTHITQLIHRPRRFP